jgi:hypothetical protein
MGEGSFKAAKGLIKVNVHVHEKTIQSIQISGDFFLYPEDSLWELEKTLHGIKAQKEPILDTIRQFLHDKQIFSPGVTAEDFTQAILLGIKNV